MLSGVYPLSFSLLLYSLNVDLPVHQFPAVIAYCLEYASRFLVADTRLYTLPCRSVGHIFEFRAVFALLLLPNRPRLDCRVSGLVFN